MSGRLVAISLVWAMLSASLFAQKTPVPIGPGIKPPRLLKKVEPELSPLARAYQIQGKVLLGLVVTEDGQPADIHVLSPLGYGLDEKAIEAVEKWKFKPAMRGQEEIAVHATIEMTFQFYGRYFDQSFERRRTSYNAAAKGLSGSPIQQEVAIATFQRLAKEDFPAALFTVGMWELTGNYVDKNEEAGLQKVDRAARKDYGPAVFQRIIRSGSPLAPKDWDAIRHAATLGSLDAQYFLGDRHERGEGTEKSADRSKNYFRLCASQGVEVCQFRLARLLFSPDRRDFEYEQALAWFSLAAKQGNNEAKQIVEAETEKLDTAQSKRVATLREQFSSALH